MTYEQLWHRLTPIYEAGEAKAIVRNVLEMQFHLSFADILCGKVTELSADNQAELEKIMIRLEKSEPVQYVLGTAFFYGRPFHVAPGVLIPRPETTELCQWIIEAPKEGSILDIGTGSGCIAITLAIELPQSHVSAWDISEEALTIAKANASTLNAHVNFEKQDALAPHIDERKWDIIVSNPPYIEPKEREEMEKNVLEYEPAIALFAPESNPIAFYQSIGNYAAKTLLPGGLLYFELNPLTANAVDSYLESIGFKDIEYREDQFHKQRFLKAKKI
jgi:release factor glutamine methyltransferase